MKNDCFTVMYANTVLQPYIWFIDFYTYHIVKVSFRVKMYQTTKKIFWQLLSIDDNLSLSFVQPWIWINPGISDIEGYQEGNIFSGQRYFNPRMYRSRRNSLCKAYLVSWQCASGWYLQHKWKRRNKHSHFYSRIN